MYVSERIDRRLKRYESSEPGRVKRTNLAVVKSSTTVLIARLFSLHVSRLFSFTTTTSFPPYFFFLSHCHTVWHLCLVLFHSASGPTLFLLSISTFFFFFFSALDYHLFISGIFSTILRFSFLLLEFFLLLSMIFLFFIAGIPRSRFSPFLKLPFLTCISIIAQITKKSLV